MTIEYPEHVTFKIKDQDTAGYALKVLRGARQLISKEENWTQQVCARDANGLEVGPTVAEACSWCTVGAISYSIQQTDRIVDGRRWVTGLISGIIKEMRPYAQGEVAHFNDHHTHQEVLEVFDQMIFHVEQTWNLKENL